MTVKTYFDLTWEGPVLDASGRPTNDVQSESLSRVVIAPGMITMVECME